MFFLFWRPARYHIFSKRLTSAKVKHLPSEKHDFASRVVPGWARMQVLSMFLKNIFFHKKIAKVTQDNKHKNTDKQKHEKT